MRTRIFFLTSVAVAGMAMTAISTPAKAATAQERHCVIDVSTPNAQASCYHTFTEAIAKATGGRVTDAPNDPAAAVKDPHLAARLNASVDKASGAGPAADVLIGIEYEDSDFEGSTYTVTAPWGCDGWHQDADWNWGLPGVLPGGWNDEIGSYRTFSGCLAKHFEHINYAGVSTAYDAGQADMGWMDDETSSIRWS
jgi:hypothetical protein